MINSDPLLENTVKDALRTLQDPYLGTDLIDARILKNVQLQNSEIVLHLKFEYPLGAFESHLREEIQRILQPLLQGLSLQIQISWKVNQHLPQNQLKPLAQVKNIIAIASGKGGVGKSTTAVNLALAMVAAGARVGILDADIYGPSQPLMLGIKEKPVVREDKRFQPMVRHGLQSMSMGYLVDEEAPMVWRGPMVSSALQQLLFETHWDRLDYLIVDLPPGTGDIQLTMAQKIPVSGAVIVTTPQDVALLDAKRALMMFRKLNINVLGVVENMSVHICAQCGHEEPIFGKEGGAKMAAQFEVPLLQQLPLDLGIRTQADIGIPIVIAEPAGQIAKLYGELALHVMAKLSLCPRDFHVPLATVTD